jgi:hypothetical protein
MLWLAEPIKLLNRAGKLSKLTTSLNPLFSPEVSSEQASLNRSLSG